MVSKTEYSSAKVGVQPLRFSKLDLFLGVSKVGLGNWADVGVWVGVGGWAFGFPKLEESGQHTKPYSKYIHSRYHTCMPVDPNS